MPDLSRRSPGALDSVAQAVRTDDELGLDKSPTLERLALSRLLASETMESQGRNLRAFGVMGSVARGTAQKYSDLDLLVIVRRNPESIPRSQIRNNIYCSFNPETWKSAMKPITNPYEPHDYIPEILGGLTRIKPLTIPKISCLGLRRSRKVFLERFFANQLS